LARSMMFPDRRATISKSQAVDNPVGYTHLVSGGGVLASPGSLIRTNKLDIESQNEVGTPANRLKVDLVGATGKPTGLDLDRRAGEAVGDVEAKGVFQIGNIGVELKLNPARR